jgi:DNA-directed RNA polymerase specialized sigma24 family protein
MAAGGFNGMEIAEAIGRTGSATRTLMCRSRLQLRHRLGAMGVAP